MKIGVISDIHSNIVAFRACVDYLEEEGCDEYFLLGDYVSDTPYTRETLDFLYEFIQSHVCYLLRGNREEYMLAQREDRLAGREEKKWIYNSASGNLLYTYEQLAEQDFAFFERLPISFVYEKEGYPSITCAHGSPESTRELLQLDGERVAKWLQRIPTDYLICAHTHRKGMKTVGKKQYYNPGCVGIAMEDKGYAQCMILHGKECGAGNLWEPEFLKVPYDMPRVVRDIRKRGLLEAGGWFVNSSIQNLLTGINRSAPLVDLAGRLSAEAGETGVWPHIREIYFAMAAKELQIPDYRSEFAGMDQTEPYDQRGFALERGKEC